MKELKEDILNAFDNYKDRKLGHIEIDPDTDFEIYKAINNLIVRYNQEIEELDESIDYYIEEMNERSTREFDLAEDDRRHYLNLTREV